MRLVVIAGCLLVVACRPPGYGKGDDQADIDAAPPVTADAAVDAAPALCDRPFRLDGHSAATAVWLTGDFVSWGANPSAGAQPLAFGADGGWTGTRKFPAGTYLYKFIVDGSQWIADPTNPDGVDDGFGGQNSRFSCAP